MQLFFQDYSECLDLKMRIFQCVLYFTGFSEQKVTVYEQFSWCDAGLRHQGKSWKRGLFFFFPRKKIHWIKQASPEKEESMVVGSPCHSALNMRVFQENNMVTSVWILYPPKYVYFSWLLQRWKNMYIDLKKRVVVVCFEVFLLLKFGFASFWFCFCFFFWWHCGRTALYKTFSAIAWL